MRADLNSKKVVPVRVRRNSKKEDLADFGRYLERKLMATRGPEAMANLACRFLTSKDEKIAAMTFYKWVEWRYGRPQDAPTITINNQPTLMISGYNDDRMNNLKQLPETGVRIRLEDMNTNADQVNDNVIDVQSEDTNTST